MLGAKAAQNFYPLFTCCAVTDSDSGCFCIRREEVKPRMGRKKSNARILPRGRKIHVNKYINKRGCTKHKSAVTHNHSTEKQQESSHTTYDSFPAYNWPTTRIPKQYEIWFAELGNHYGTSVQSGNRPVLVISNDMANRNSPIITVIPMSSKLKKLELPVHIPVTGRDCEMLRDEELEESILLVEQITTIDKMVLCNRLCRVTSAKKKQEIEAAVKKQFAMQACMGREAQA